MFKNLSINSIVESKTNPRSYFSEEALQELAESIKSKGVLQPIIVRSLAKDNPDNNLFELVCGSRRLRSCKIAEIAEIPCNILELSDEEVLEIQITENLQRENVNAIDEALAFKLMLQHANTSLAIIASKTGKSIDFVKGRLKLNELIEEAKFLVYNNILPVNHATKISMLSEKRQKEALKFVSVINSDKETIAVKPLHELNHWIKHNIVKDLNAAPFDIKSNKLLPSAGSCIDCKKNTSENTTLFADYETNNCLDTACYNEKLRNFISTKKEKLEKKHGQEIVLVSDMFWNAPEGMLKQHDNEEKTKETKCANCKLGMIAHSTSGKEGTELFLCVKSSCSETESSTVKSDEEILKNKKEAIKNHTKAIAIAMTEKNITIETFDKKVLKMMFFLNLFIHMETSVMKDIVNELGWEYLDENNVPCEIDENVTPATMFIDNFRGLPKEIEVIENHVALENIKGWIDNSEVNNMEEEFKTYYQDNIMNVVLEMAQEKQKIAKKLAEFNDAPDRKKIKDFTVDDFKFVYKNGYSITQLAKKLEVPMLELSETPTYEEIFELLKK
jgi:ParB/RepB/Spo0J family partition protein